uniref:Uncharacterized protein n=1 Tax=Lactuca sativa TaxID=4236 RepID=A0A9R1XK30_LACSA|nr:hypothetical protein LSAT_V11C300139750 [Lactuca sativa]
MMLKIRNRRLQVRFGIESQRFKVRSEASECGKRKRRRHQLCGDYMGKLSKWKLQLSKLHNHDQEEASGSLWGQEMQAPKDFFNLLHVELIDNSEKLKLQSAELMNKPKEVSSLSTTNLISRVDNNSGELYETSKKNKHKHASTS